MMLYSNQKHGRTLRWFAIENLWFAGPVSSGRAICADSAWPDSSNVGSLLNAIGLVYDS